jgi:hypothetical protein
MNSTLLCLLLFILPREFEISLANFQILGPLGCQGLVVIPKSVKKPKSLHPNEHLGHGAGRNTAKMQRKQLRDAF